MAEISKKYPNLSIAVSEDFSQSDTNGIWVRGTEERITASDGRLLFDYYAEDYLEKHYIIGIHKEINALVESLGWFFEWYDAGTAFIYQQ